MGKRSSVLLAVIFFCIFMLNFRCEKDQVLRPFEQEFEIPVSITSLKKTYSLTDTIWLEAEVTGKHLLDKKTNQEVLADTGQIYFNASYYGFGLKLSNPVGGFADVITNTGVNTNRRTSQWSNEGFIDRYGCAQATYRFRIGFKPNHKGTYSLILSQDLLMEGCNNKLVPYYATTSYRFSATDLNLDLFNSLAKAENFSSDQKLHFIRKIDSQEMFVFKVE